MFDWLLSKVADRRMAGGRTAIYLCPLSVIQHETASAWDSIGDWNWAWKRSRIWVDSGQLDNWMTGQWPRQARPVHQKFSEAKSSEKERQIGSDQGVTGRVSVKKVDASMKNTNEQPEQNAVGQQDSRQIQIQPRYSYRCEAGLREKYVCTCTCQFGLWKDWKGLSSSPMEWLKRRLYEVETEPKC